MAKAKFSGCSVDITPGGNVSFRCLIDPKSDCDFCVERPDSKIPWNSCSEMSRFGFCDSDDCRKNAVKQARRRLLRQS